ncbi:unnamed protein product [Lupinus luteus]|uniref:F-box domain-containing protein n=1 Tax=Lupinus luteus TaxID=3873 RepID=A0AAV1VQL0_LUPLU
MATIVASIEYLAHEILLCLPVKSVLRFKCVSKQWLALISEPKFCHLHTLSLYRSSRVFPSFLFLAHDFSSTCEVILIKTNDVSDSSNFRNVEVPIGTVIQSCNGLILIKNITFDLSDVEYFICNPTTNKSVPVIFPSKHFRNSLESLFICFDPLKSPHYKLVSIGYKYYTSECYFTNMILSKFNPSTEYVCNIYSSETDSWVEPGFTFTASDAEAPHQRNAVYLNGVLYCYMFRLEKFCCFDFETQSFKTCPMPLMMENRRVSYFGESGGFLLFVLPSSLWIEILKLNVENFEFSLVKKWESTVYEEICSFYHVFLPRE